MQIPGSKNRPERSTSLGERDEADDRELPRCRRAQKRRRFEKEALSAIPWKELLLISAMEAPFVCFGQRFEKTFPATFLFPLY